MTQRLPTLARYRALRRDMRGVLILRALQYEALRLTETSGRLLDVGGGSQADYRNLLNCDTYHSINIDPGIDPTWVLDIGDHFPTDSDSYDVALSMNTFEHVFKPDFLITEMTKALRPGGRFVATTPFLYRIHAHPHDYFRPTQTWWQDSLAEHGYTDIEVTPLNFGPHTTAICACTLSRPARALRGHLAVLFDLIFAGLRSGNPERLRKTLSVFPVGYFITATKPCSGG